MDDVGYLEIQGLLHVCLGAYSVVWDTCQAVRSINISCGRHMHKLEFKYTMARFLPKCFFHVRLQ